MSPSKPWKHKCRGTRTDGEPCTRWAIIGGDVCPKHGAGAPQVKAAAARRLARAQAEDELRRFGQPVDMEPTEGLLSMVRVAAGMVAALSGWVVQSDDGTQLNRLAGGGSAVVEHVHMVMFREWCDRLVSYSAAAKRAGVEDQRVAIEEAQAEIFGQFVRDLLTSAEFGLSSEQQQHGLAVAGRLMRALPPAA